MEALAATTPSTSNSRSSNDPDPRAADALWTLWQQMTAMFPGTWSRQNGAAPFDDEAHLTTAGETWLQVISGMTPRQLSAGLAACLRSGLQWPPNPPRFRAMCFGLPSLAQVQQEMAPSKMQCGFTVLVRSILDLHVYNAADDGFQQQRMLTDAYDRAVAHVMEGGEVPAAVAALEAPKADDLTVRNPDAAREAMRQAAAELGFGGAHGAG
ncbi:hypothetical protein LR961_05510 [Stenotrophomonas sp. SY1]|nr:hypothetical protein [Stenotrophomonas sp. SY1]